MGRGKLRTLKLKVLYQGHLSDSLIYLIVDKRMRLLSANLSESRPYKYKLTSTANLLTRRMFDTEG